jgi:hypothetical protein
VIECFDKAKTTITIDADLSSEQISAAAAATATVGATEKYGQAGQPPPPRLCVMIDPKPDRVHFCASFFPPSVYHVVGYSSADVDHRVDAAAADSAVGTLQQPKRKEGRRRREDVHLLRVDDDDNNVHVADVRACARFLCAL